MRLEPVYEGEKEVWEVWVEPQVEELDYNGDGMMGQLKRAVEKEVRYNSADDFEKELKKLDCYMKKKTKGKEENEQVVEKDDFG
jgi:hypothetical protein